MIETKQDEQLQELLAQRRPTWESSEGLLSYLAAAATANNAACAALAAALTTADDVAWVNLAEWAADWPGVPESSASLSAWLRDTEELGLAYVGLSRISLSEKLTAASILGANIRKTLDVAREVVSLRSDLVRFAGEAEKRITALGVVEPWEWVSGGTVSGFLASSSAASREVCELWVDRRLHSRDSAVLSELLESDDALLAMYREVIRERTTEIWVTRWNPKWSLDVARSEDELSEARSALNTYLPHIDHILTVRQHEAGTWWSHGLSDFVPFASGEEIMWGDTTLESMSTLVRVVEPSADEDVWHGLSSLRRVARGDGGKRGLEVTGALIADLTNGDMAQALTDGHQAFEEGLDLASGTERLISHAFEVRVVVPDAIMALATGGLEVESLTAALNEADEVHAGHSSAVQLVDDELYEDLTEGVALDQGAWWGSRDVLDRLVPRGVVEGALQQLRVERREKSEQRSEEVAAERRPGSGEASTKTVISFSSRRAKAPQVRKPIDDYAWPLAASDRPVGHASSCSWLGPDGPDVGAAPVLLVDPRESGLCAELRVSTDEHPANAQLWRDAKSLQAVARETIEAAWLAAGSLTPDGVAPYSFEQHRLEFVVDGAPHRSVDGSSLGLSAALAFASAWTGKSITPGVVPMASLTGGRLVAVFEASQKAEAVALENAQFLVVSGNESEVLGSGRRALVVKDVAEALTRAGLSLDDVAYKGDRHELQMALTNLVAKMRMQKLGEGATWRGVADEGARLLTLLKARGAGDYIEESHQIALAYFHAGAPSLASDFIVTSNDASIEDQAMSALLLVLVDIDLTEAKSSEAKRKLLTLFEELKQGGKRGLLGLIAGTLGRAEMHAYALDKAIPWLEEAVAIHQTTAPHEVARSRNYLAMALRMAGQSTESLDELVQAKRELVEWTRPESRQLERSTEIFVNYELARTLLALDRPEEALEFAEQALAECRPGEFWPRLGVLRARAWALRMCDRDAEADLDVAAMREWRASSDSRVVDVLIEEAEGYPVDDGEVY